MAIIRDTIGYGLAKTAKQVMSKMGIRDNSLLIYYDTRNSTLEHPAPVFLSKPSLFDKSNGISRESMDDLNNIRDWKDLVYFDCNVCGEAKQSNIVNISHHTHELQHYYQWHNHQECYKLMMIYKRYYSYLTTEKLSYYNYPLDYDAEFKVKQILYELVGKDKVDTFCKENPYENGKETVWAVLNKIDISKVYDFEKESKRVICKHKDKLRELQLNGEQENAWIHEFDFDKLCQQ